MKNTQIRSRMKTLPLSDIQVQLMGCGDSQRKTQEKQVIGFRETMDLLIPLQHHPLIERRVRRLIGSLRRWVHLDSSRGRHPRHLMRQVVALANQYRPLTTIVIIRDIRQPTPAGNLYTREALEKLIACRRPIPVCHFRQIEGDTARARMESVTNIPAASILGTVKFLQLEGHSLVGYATPLRDLEELPHCVRFGLRTMGRYELVDGKTINHPHNLVSIDVIRDPV